MPSVKEETNSSRPAPTESRPCMPPRVCLCLMPRSWATCVNCSNSKTSLTMETAPRAVTGMHLEICLKIWYKFVYFRFLLYIIIFYFHSELKPCRAKLSISGKIMSRICHNMLVVSCICFLFIFCGVFFFVCLFLFFNYI